MQAAQKAESQGAGNEHSAETPAGAVEGRGHKVRAMLKVQLGDEVYSSWFKSLEFESFDGRIVKVSVPVKFVRNWIQEHYSEHLLRCSRVEFPTAERVEVVWRQPGAVPQRSVEPRTAEAPHASAALSAPVA
ncbi:MAG TPA: DnaA N-terminal domain-containing protein, partial [Hyphomicrobium sp.]|nr:DnaA N-terminal domain-containing protein [Hyphomicrobium sp.]